MAFIDLPTLNAGVLQRANMVGSNYPNSTQLTAYTNYGYSQLYDLLVETYEDYFLTTASFTLSPGQNTFPLPTDFYKLKGIDRLDVFAPSGMPVYAYNYSERGNLNTQAAGNFLYLGLPPVQYRVEGTYVKFLPQDRAAGIPFILTYIPKYTPLVFGTDASLILQDLTYTAVLDGIQGNSINIAYVGGGSAGSETVTVNGQNITVAIQNGVSTASQIQIAVAASTSAAALISTKIIGMASHAQTTTPQTFLSGGINDGGVEGINGWDEYIMVTAAIQVMMDEESDTQALERRQARLEKRILDMAPGRDSGLPKRVADVRGDVNSYWGLGTRYIQGW